MDEYLLAHIGEDELVANHYIMTSSSSSEEEKFNYSKCPFVFMICKASTVMDIGKFYFMNDAAEAMLEVSSTSLTKMILII